MERKYENEESPINILFDALVLLQRGWNDRTERYLHVLSLGEEPYIEYAVFNGGYTKDLHSGSKFYLISPEIAKEIVEQRYVEGIPEWGYTDKTKLLLTERGQKQLRVEWEKKIEEMKAKLVPGTHGASSLYRYRGIRHFYREGHPLNKHKFYSFDNPFGDQFAVFSSGEVVILEEKEKE